MNKKIPITSAVLLALNVSGIQAALILDGTYNLVINTTPTLATSYGGTIPIYGKAGSWNSSFTFGGVPPGGDKRGMTDNGIIVNTAGGARGTSVEGDGYAGSLGITVSNGAIAINSFQVDAVLDTAGGHFVQYSSTASAGSSQTSGTENMYGAVDDLGNMTLNPVGRLGSVSGFAWAYDKRWNYFDVNADPAANYWSFFTTGTATNSGGSITGSQVVNIGDINDDFIDDYKVTLVSASGIGSDWLGFKGVPYAEVWNAKILSAVPVPSAIWLFGSGLLGIAGFTRRRSRR